MDNAHKSETGYKLPYNVWQLALLTTGMRCVRSLCTQVYNPTTRLLVRGSLAHVHGPTTPPLSNTTVGELLAKTAQRYPHSLGLCAPHQDVRWSWRELNERVDELAAGLRAIGIRKGDHVGSWLPNVVEYIALQYATARLGALLVTLNPAYRVPELTHALKLAQVKAIFMVSAVKASNYVEMLTAAKHDVDREKLPLLEHVVVTSIGEGSSAIDDAVAAISTSRFGRGRSVRAFADVLAAAAELANKSNEMKWVEEEEEIENRLSCFDGINIQFTSGTTGLPKAVELTHHNIVNNGANIAKAQRLGESDSIALAVPLYHCFGLVLGSIAGVTSGATIVMPSATFDAEATLRAVEAERCTSLYGVPTMFIAQLALIDSKKKEKKKSYDLSSLRTGIVGGSVCPPHVLTRVVKEMHMREVTNAYGMTESSPVSWQSAIDTPFEKRAHTVGRVHPHVEGKVVRVVDNVATVPPETVSVNEQGELWTRGYNVMKRYFANESATRNAVTDDGWLKTGDLARIDEGGWLQIVGRIKDTVIRGGENIAPTEVEDVLFAHKSVRNASVIGVPCPIYGEQLMAVIVHETDNAARADASEDTLREWCKERLSHFKVPKYFRFVEAEDLPLTVSGKIMKNVLREESVAILLSNK